MVKPIDPQLKKMLDDISFGLDLMWREAQRKAARKLWVETGIFAVGLVATIFFMWYNPTPMVVLPTLVWVVAFGCLLVKLYSETSKRIYNMMSLQLAQKMVEDAITERTK